MFRFIRPGLAIAAALIAAASGNALAASGNGSTVSGSASAQVMAPMQLTAVSALQFGTIAQPAIGGTLTMSPYGTLTSTGDMGASSSIAQTGPRTAASFTLTGTPGALYTISGVSQVTISNGSNTMTVGRFTTNVWFAVGQIGVDGTSSFNIGGTLTASAGQAPGSYTGTFPIIVAYY